MSFFVASEFEAGTSAGFVSAAFSTGFAISSACFAKLGTVAVVSGFTEAVVSILKSAMVGGGTFAGSGRGIAASIASSAAVLRAVSACANAAVAETVRKVA